MTKVYLSGPIQGMPLVKAQAAFAKAAFDVYDYINDELDIVNPAALPQTCTSWGDYILRDLLILKGCEVIAMLPDWKSSPGARVEHEFAIGCGIKVIELAAGAATRENSSEE